MPKKNFFKNSSNIKGFEALLKNGRVLGCNYYFLLALFWQNRGNYGIFSLFPA